MAATDEELDAAVKKAFQPGFASAVGSGVLQGGTLGFGDELAGLAAKAGRAVGNATSGVAPEFQEQGASDYTEARDAARAQNAAASEAHPVGYVAGNLLGALPTALAGGAALQGAGKALGAPAWATSALGSLGWANRAKQGAAIGGALGAVGGAGASESTDAGDMLPSMAQGTAMGMGTGAALSTLGPPVLGLLARGLRRFAPSGPPPAPPPAPYGLTPASVPPAAPATPPGRLARLGGSLPAGLERVPKIGSLVRLARAAGQPGAAPAAASSAGDTIGTVPGIRATTSAAGPGMPAPPPVEAPPFSVGDVDAVAPTLTLPGPRAPPPGLQSIAAPPAAEAPLAKVLALRARAALGPAIPIPQGAAPPVDLPAAPVRLPPAPVDLPPVPEVLAPAPAMAPNTTADIPTWLARSANRSAAAVGDLTGKPVTTPQAARAQLANMLNQGSDKAAEVAAAAHRSTMLREALAPLRAQGQQAIDQLVLKTLPQTSGTVQDVARMTGLGLKEVRALSARLGLELTEAAKPVRTAIAQTTLRPVEGEGIPRPEPMAGAARKPPPTPVAGEGVANPYMNPADPFAGMSGEQLYAAAQMRSQLSQMPPQMQQAALAQLRQQGFSAPLLTWLAGSP